jgi:salicylate hydroxylase
MSETDYKFRVAIAQVFRAASAHNVNILYSGCGIGGLALAAFISRFAQHPEGRIAVDIYEAKSEVSTIGAGVAIWKRSWQVLQDLGFEEEIVKKGFKVPKDGECGCHQMQLLYMLTTLPARGPIFRKSDQPTEGYDFHNHMMPCSCIPIILSGFTHIL